VVHPDVPVAGGGEPGDDEGEEGELHVAVGDAGRVDPLLVGAGTGEEGERVDGEAVGPEAEDGVEGRVEGSLVLAGEAVDEIHVDRPEPEPARLGVEGLGLLGRLVAADELLDGGVDVLHPEGDAGEPEPGENGEVLGGRHPRIGLEGDLRPGSELEAAGELGVEAGEGVGGVERRGPAAPVVLDDPAPVPEPGGDEVRLGEDPAEVRVGDVGMAGDDDVAGAERAAGLAEREVEVEGEGPPGRRGGGGEELGVVVGADGLGELDGRRVRRVPGAGPVVPGEELRCDVDHSAADR